MEKCADYDVGRVPGWVKNCWLKMKLLVFGLAFLGLTTVSAKTLSQEIFSVKVEEKTLAEVFKEISRVTGYEFMYSSSELRHVGKVSVDVREQDLDAVMAACLEGTGLGYKVEDNIVIVSPKYAPVPGMQQVEERKVSGVVKDQKGAPLPGVAVVLKGTTMGTATDVDGKYTLTLPEGNYTLVFSMLGMKVREELVGDRTEINVVMEEEVAEMDEVVVTGIFKKARESYTGAVSTITDEELKVHRGQNLLQTLKNIDASLNFRVNNLAGSNPNALPEINIRGNSSLPMSVEEFNTSASNAVNTPLIIMDGFEISLEKLMDYNDEEIESINILKDAAATAIYGSRGSNGVIVVITKQPEAGKLRVNAEVGIDMEVPDLTSYDLLNAREKLELEKEVGLYDTDYVDNDLTFKGLYYERLRRVLSGMTTDWIDKPIRTGVGSHYNLRLEGGSDQFRWSATANYKNVAGAMKNSYRRTFNGSITLMYSIKNLIFKNYTSYGVQRGQESNYGSFSDYVAQQPYNSPYDEHGNLLSSLEYFYGPSRGNGEPNPLYDAMLNTMDKDGYEELTNNFSIEWNIIEGLTLRGQFGITTKTNHSDYFLPAEHSYFTTGANYDIYNTEEGFFRRGRYEYGTGTMNSWSGNVTLSYSNLFAEKHQLYVGLDYSIAGDKTNNYTFVLEGFSNEDMNYLGNARQYEKDGMPTGIEGVTRRLGFTGNVNYTYDNRYYVDLSGRVDGSSTFGSDKKYAPFWSAGIGWNLHQEDFLKGHNWINTLRLKVSYGQTGSQTGSGSGAATEYVYQTANKYMNWMGATLSAWGNPELTWQTTDEFNVGTEIGLWNGRIKGEFDFYTKKTSNLLSSMEIPHSMGLSSYIANVGEVKNRGWEASLTAYLVRDTEREFNVMLSGQLVYEKNWISKLSEAVKEQNEALLADEDYEVANLFYEGNPQNAIYAVRSLGIDPSTGQEVYLDKDGNITDEWKPGDKVYMGSADPLYRGNLNAMVMWKGLTFNAGFYYYWGGKTYNSTLVDRVEVTTDYLTTSNVDRRVYEDRWQKPGDHVFYKAFSNEETRATSRFVMRDNVLELSSVSLQYRWDTDWVHKYLGAQSVTFGVNMNDLFHWGSIKQERGIDYPFARNIQGSIRFLF